MVKYVWPTSRGWIFIIVAFVWFIIARVNHNSILLCISCLAFAMLASSLAYAFLALKKIRYTRETADDIRVGRITPLPVTCQNLKAISRQSFSISENIPFADIQDVTAIVPPLPPHGTCQFTRTVMPVKRGEFKYNDLVARDTDPAGLFYREEIIPLNGTVVVYPPRLPIHTFVLPSHEQIGVSRNSPHVTTAGLSQNIFGIREYQSRDGMSAIHWKSTAKYRKLMVREFERNENTSVAILLDASTEQCTPRGNANLECAVTLASSLCERLRNEFCSLAFAAGGDKLRVRSPLEATEAVGAILYDLAVVHPGKHSLPEAINGLASRLPSGTIVYCFTLSDSEDICQALSSLVQSDMELHWFVAPRETFDARHHSQKEVSPTPPSVIPRKFITPAMTADQIFNS